MTILEIEYYQKDTLLWGKNISKAVLKKQLEEIEITYDHEEDNFIELLCRKYGWTVLQTKESPDYIYDRDTGMLLEQIRENRWPYANIRRDEFLDKMRLAEAIIQKNGATYVGDSREAVTSIQADGDCLSENVAQHIWQIGKEYIRVDKIYFKEKPFIVLEFAENPNGPYEDADPISYDMSDDEFEQEINKIL